MKLFIVEDFPPVRERLRGMLGMISGVRIVGEAPDVTGAVAGILEAKPDVVVLDLQLGTGSGFEVLDAVHPREPGIDFYMLSNFASEPYRRHAARLGARAFFDKSNEFERVRDAVAERAAVEQPH
jgi:DNA-binding NarL/FixJ family response regulator